MKKITISPEIKDLTPTFCIGVMTCDINVSKDETLNDLITKYETKIEETIDIKEVVTLETIIDGRNAYKKYGKDPSRYRLAVESLYRRLSKGNQLYRINNVVDLGNILSIETRKSVAVLDMDKIEGDITIRLGNKNDRYLGIGRGELNIDRIPLYEDNIGPFGSVTSDTERTMITSNTNSILLFIISFSGDKTLQKELEFATKIYQKYANAKNIKTTIKK